jgi:NhaA family Na+:H+ antiporter
MPGLAAIGGMVMPALIYLFFNRYDPASMAGWAIPTATDIAFALGVLALLGSRVPTSLKLFVMTLAVVDDLFAIVIIAIFYSGDLSLVALALSALCVAVLAFLNWRNVRRFGPYLLVGLVFWVCVLKSGVHATLAGVICAFFIPLRGEKNSAEENSPLESLEHHLHPYVAYLILPVFGFANAGVALFGLTLRDLLAPVPLGIGLGLLLGKFIGIMSAVVIAHNLRWAALPKDCHYGHMIGVSLLCGIGFTMSLFIASLAFEAGGNHLPGTDRLGILMGSFLSALLGYFVLRWQKPTQ